MTVLRVLLLLFGLPACFYLPGWALERAVLGVRMAARGIELQVMRVVASVLLSGWISFLLAEWGVWGLGPLFLVLALIVVPALFFARTHPASARNARLHIVAPWTHARLASIPAALSLGDGALLVAGLVFALLVARPFEVVRGGLDAGVYALTGIAIAQTGGIVQDDPVVAEIGRRARGGDTNARHVMNNFLGTQNPVRYLATRLRASGFFLATGDWAKGRVVPQFFHLWPVWIALGTGFGGVYGGLLMTGAWGLLGVLLLGLLGRRVTNPLAGVGAALFLALNSVQVWFSRMPVSEALIQGLTLAGLWAYTHFADEPGGREGVWWGSLAGVAFGEIALAKIDFFLTVGPALLLLLYVAISQRWRAGHSAMLLALGALLLHAGLHVIFIARAYFVDTGYAPLSQVSALVEWLVLPLVTPEMRVQLLIRPNSALRHAWRLPLEIGILLGLVAAGYRLWRRPRPLWAVESWLRRHRAYFLGAVALALAAWAVYGYLVRPRIIDAALLQSPLSPASRSRLAGYIGAPIAIPSGMRPAVARDQANFARFGWYVSPLGILLGSLGGVLFWWRGFSRRSWLLLLIATAYTLFYMNSLYGTQDRTYIYILRRFVPVVYPAWSLAMAYGLWWLGQGRRWRLPRRLIAAGLTALLLLFFVFTGRNVYAHVEYGGAIKQFEALASQIGPRDIVLVRGGGADVAARDASDIVAGPLTYLFDRNALTFKGSDPNAVAAALAQQVGRWQSEGRAVYALLAASGGDWRFPGLVAVPQLDWTWSYQEFQQLADQKPYAAGPSSIAFRLYRLAPAGAVREPSQITPVDTGAQVAGIHRAERDRTGFFAWTTRQATLRLTPDPARSPTNLTLTLAAGPRPRALGPARICVDITPEIIPYPKGGRDAFRWQSLGCQTVERDPAELRLPLPNPLQPQPYLVRLAARPWTPSAVAPDPGDPPSADARELGVRWYAARFDQ